jgi:hypothetical protein
MKNFEQNLRQKNYYELVRSVTNGKNETAYDKDLIQVTSEAILQIIDHLYVVITKGEAENFESPEISDMSNELVERLEAINGLKDIQVRTTISEALNKALNKLSARIFKGDGRISEYYGYEYYLRDFVENQLVGFILQDERFQPWQVVSKLIEYTELLDNFYSAFSGSFPRSWIDADISSWRNQENIPILQQLSVMERQQFQNLETEWTNEPEKTIYANIKKALRSWEYAMLRPALAFKTKVLLKKSPDDWLIFWDRLEVPMLQLLALRHAPSPETLQEIAVGLVNYQGQLQCSKTQLAVILLLKFKDVCTDIGRRLDFYRHHENWPQNPSTDYNKELLNEGARIANDWFNGLADRFKAFFGFISTIIPQQELVNWLLEQRVSGGSPVYQELANEDLGKIWQAVRDFLPLESKALIGLLRPKLNIRQFGFVFDQLESQLSTIDAEEMIQLLSDLVAQKGFFWDMSFTAEYWLAIKAASHLLSKCSDPIARAQTLLREFTVYYEGWEPSSEYDNVIRESFILSCLILLMEHDSAFKGEDTFNKFFRDIMAHIITQTRFAGESDRNYNSPLLLMSLIANGSESIIKTDFESKLIDELDDFQSLVKTLSAGKNPLGHISKAKFAKRTEAEMPFISNKFEQRDLKHEIRDMESSVGILLND